MTSKFIFLTFWVLGFGVFGFSGMKIFFDLETLKTLDFDTTLHVSE